MMAGLLILTTIANGGEATVTEPASKEQTDQAPLWSTDINGDYTLGSKIINAADFGAQAVYRYEVEVLRNLHLFKNTIFSWESIPKGSTSHGRTVFTLPP